MTALPLLVPAMLAAGIVGGLINWFTGTTAEGAPLAWWKHVTIGVGAAFIVPVFLNMISSTLVGDINGELYDARVVAKLLVLTGFCLLAALASRLLLRPRADRAPQAVAAARQAAPWLRQDAAPARAPAEPTLDDDLDWAEDEPLPAAKAGRDTTALGQPLTAESA